MNLVSTHSRLKAAGETVVLAHYRLAGFNTQPPEGGWFRLLSVENPYCGFNTQPPEGGWQRCFVVD